MPSKPKGRSEYKTNFKWFESFRAKDFEPSAEQLAPAAGQGSVFCKTSDEPALQHKKRVDGPPSSFSINLDHGHYKAADDFAVLGKNSKFADNVAYGLRPGKAPKASSKDKGKDINKNNNADFLPPHKQMKITEKQTVVRRKPEAKESVPSKKEASKENLTPSTPPPAPRTKGDKPQKGAKQQDEKQGLKDKNLADILPPSKAAAKEKTSKGQGKAPVNSRLNEAGQTDMDKGVAVSSPEAPADYSLKYRAGVAPARPSRKASEYQKEFSWKKGIPASPLLSAEQIIYNSNAQLASPPKKSVVPKRTEYQAQFKTFPLPEPDPFAPKPSQHAPVQRGRTKTQMKRSKSVGAGLSPDRIAAAGSAPVTSADDPRLLRESRDASPVPKVPIDHGKIKHKVTEYNSNFKSPVRFSYEGGAWRDAYPAHLLQNKNGLEGDQEKADTGALDSDAPASWFDEVLELRRRANEYKRRAQGTHFSREHLVQLLAQQTGYWDADSARSSRVSSLDALNLEPAGLPSFKAKAAEEKAAAVEDRVSTMAVQGDSPEPEEDVSSIPVDNLRPTKKGRRGRGRKVKKAWQEEASSEVETPKEPEQLDTNQNAACDTPSEEMEETDEGPGRLPTPVLRQKGENSQRHHLDRTTPSVGGVLLSVPDRQMSARSGDTEDTVTESQPSLKVKLNSEKLHTSPLLGKPTPDTHALRDETADSDEVMDTQYIPSPQRTLAKADRKLKALQRRLKAKIPDTIDERMACTYNKDRGSFSVDDLPLVPNGTRDDDALSVSAMSIASSGSLASEVYERARRRRDQFWGKPGE